ncbi:arsenate reductase ArsC [Variovorax sp. LT1R16]|uniref:arsenate reductase ArsC n=1 Tax=Variovorax sp. LT1R16 TaxID=3443728 RepID=UPI003F45D238
MQADRPTRVLFICNDDAVRGVMAAALLNELGKGRFQAYSAGSRPSPDGRPDARTVQTLEDAGMQTAGLRSKAWDEFATDDAPPMDLIVTVCDETAGETCPIWPGRPATALWSYPDPRGAMLQEDPHAFVHVLHAIRRHVELLVNLPADRIHRLVLQAEARRIGIDTV